MRNSAELASRDELERFPGLECKTVLGDVDLDDLAGSRANVEASCWVGRLGQFREGEVCCSFFEGGIGRRYGFVDEHC